MVIVNDGIHEPIITQGAPPAQVVGRTSGGSRADWSKKVSQALILIASFLILARLS
jgi:hypothetical protein